MSTIIKRIFSLLMCFILTAALTACQESGVFINNDENGNAYTLSNEIHFSSQSLRSINPINSPDNDFYHIGKLVYDSLVSLDDTLAPQPSLASEWNINADSLTAEFTLKSNVKFSDGTTLRAGDVVFSFNACKSSSESPYKSGLSNVVSASASGDTTVVFKLKSAQNISLASFVFPVVSSSQFSSEKNFLENAETPVIGTGLYKISSADLKNSIDLEPNTEYYGTKASNNIEIEISPVEQQYTGFVESGELSMIIETSTDREDISGNEKLNVTEFTSNEFETLGFNCSSGPCAEVKLRQAISYMIDRDDIKRTAYYNSGIKSDDLYYPGYYGTEIKNTYTADESKAKTLLLEAGYRDSNGDGLVENEKGSKLTLKLVTNADNLSRKTAAEMIADTLLGYGITVNITEVSSESFTSSASSGRYDLFVGGWKVSEDYDLRSFYHSSYNNPASYKNETLDGYLDAMQSGKTNDEMITLLERAKEIIENDVPYLCLMYKTYAAVTTSNLEGIVAPRFNDYYYACDDWKIRKYKDTSSDDTEAQSDVQS
jgi:peptide/nickel transport system substrate-binding protein